jgi:hypothetical protein
MLGLKQREMIGIELNDTGLRIFALPGFEVLLQETF